MSLENTFERIAVALERLAFGEAGRGTTIDLGVVGSANTAAQATGAKTEATGTEGAKAKAKAAAEAKAKAKAEAEAKASAKDDDFLGDGPDADVALVPTKDEVRKKLTEYGNKTSNKIARELMVKIGGSEALGQVPETKYLAIVKAVDEAVKALG